MVLPGRRPGVSDELNDLVDAFNQMRENLRSEFDARERYEEALRVHQEQLEETVEKRTDELAQKNIELETQNTIVRRSEERYRLLAGNLRDIIVHVRADGKRLFVSNSALDVLGYVPAELVEPRWELVHPDDMDAVRAAMERAFSSDEPQRLIFRLLHKEGHYVWMEALARRVYAGSKDRLPEIVYSARDVTLRVTAQHADADSRRRLQAIANAMPAIIAYLDKNCVYEFANSEVGELMRRDPAELIGMTLREAIGEATYKVIEPYVISALCGEKVTYERVALLRGEKRHLEVTFIPDVTPDGSVCGFFALSYDITERKQTELSLSQQARRDSLTGLANRREFEQRLEAATALHNQKARPIALMLIDVDRFKEINDTLGHAAGDSALLAVARRLQSCVYDTDLVARLGGDEFAVLLDNAPEPNRVQLIAERMMAAMRRPILIEAEFVQVTLSVGIALSTQATTPKLITEEADRALYRVKAAGRNAFELVVS